jgi:hypothetical protein
VPSARARAIDGGPSRIDPVLEVLRGLRLCHVGHSPPRHRRYTSIHSAPTGSGRGQRKIEDRDRLPVATPLADGDDLRARVQVDTLDGDRHPEHRRLERPRQVLVQHRESARRLLRLAVGVDGRPLDHVLELRLADAWTARVSRFMSLT